MKKMLSFLLAFVMVVGLMPLSAMAADHPQYGTWLGESADGSGTYQDRTARADKKYEYTIVDSRGRTSKVQVAGEPATGTGNTIDTQTGSDRVYYQKVTDPMNAQNGTYLLVAGDEAIATNSIPEVNKVSISNDRIDQKRNDLEWDMTRKSNKEVHFKHAALSLGIEQTSTGSYMDRKYYYDVSSVHQNENKNFKLRSAGGDKVKIYQSFTEKWGNEVDVYLYVVGPSAQRGRVGATKDQNEAAVFTLYEKRTESDTTYTVNTAGLDALLARSFNQSEYTKDSWKTYADARAAAEAAKGRLENPYTDRTAAEQALTEINRVHRELEIAMDNLKPIGETPDPENPETQPGEMESIIPEIYWERTFEYPYTEQGFLSEGKLVTDQPYLDPNDIQKIQWDWNAVRDLDTDSRMTVWDYNTPEQYADLTRQEGVIGATWNKRNSEGYIVNYEDNLASFRKFAGTFEWPAGYTLKDKATITSVNDANYQGIYDYVANDPTLNERFGGKKVIPVNDDMYVYVYRDGEDPSQWDAREAEKHMVFWTGTDGKGRWSGQPKWGDQWARKVPATYLDKSAVPAYYGVYPNNIDLLTGDGVTTAKPIVGNEMKMSHTDGWYTLVDTNVLMSTLSRLYPKGLTDGETIHFDIYAFDNDTNGGMDKLEIKFEKAPASTSSVRVEYYVQAATPGNLLGTTVMNAVELGKQINLSGGTANNELNHMKAAAETRVKAQVKNGEQLNAPLVVQADPEKNVIKVLYELETDNAQYFTYDFGVTNEFEYVVKDERITKAELEPSGKAVGDALSVEARGGKAYITFTPGNADGQVLYENLILDYGQSTGVKVPIRIIPASNVLYEENMMQPDTSISGAAWSQTSHSPVTVRDNASSVFGYTDQYQNSTGANGQWKATLTPDGTDRFSQDLNFSFTGQGLDIIGSCGPNTGTLGISISKPDGTRVKNYLVDTSFTRGEIEQVPLVHAVLPEGGTYHVTISGANMGGGSKSAMSTMSTMAAAPAGADGASAYDLFERMGLTEDEIDEVEYIGMEDVLSQSVSTFAAAPAAATQSGNQTVALDGFRVYRASSRSGRAYPAAEQDVTYTNVMADGINGSITAFIDNNENGSYNVTDYEKQGGPENEIYLAQGQAIVFELADPSVKTAHISARAVEGTPALIDGAKQEHTLTHNTEMYYDVAVQNGKVAVGNNGTGLLALGNLKAACGITSVADQAQAVQMVMTMFAMPEPEPEPEPSPEFLVFFELDKWGYGWEDGSPRHQAKQFTVTEQDGITAPAMNPGEGYRLVCWKAVDQDLTLAESELLTVQAMEDCADWTGRERLVIFRPVVEEIEAEEKFEPEHFDIRLSVERGYTAKYVNVNVEASEEVAYITVNGQRIDATNADWVEFGFDPYLIFVTDLELGRNDEVAIEIVAYDESGNASEVFLARE